MSSSAVAEEFGVSEMTIRRDLHQLHLDGSARRVPGGASRPTGLLRGAPFEERDRRSGREKAAIAALCAEQLRGVQTVTIDAGTTAAAVAELLDADTTVVTHSVPVIATCTERDDLRLVALGGTYQAETRSFAGPMTRDALARLSIDVAVLSATAIDESGLLCANEFDADIKQAMMAAARRTILVADSTKIGARAAIRFGTMADVDLVITSDAANADARRILDASPAALYASASSA